MKVAEEQRTAISILKKVAECLMKEVECWDAHVKALHKAKKDETTAIRKAEEKAEKAKKLAEQKAAEKQQRELEKQRKKNAEEAAKAAAQAGEEVPSPLGLGQQKKRRRTGGQSELTEDDPTILREMSTFSAGSMVFADNLQDFGRRVCLYPDVPCGVRLKKGPLAKALEADPSIDSKTLQHLKKNISADATDFYDKARQQFKDPSGKDRVSASLPGPAASLGLDNFLSHTVEEVMMSHQMQALNHGILDRQYVTTVMLDSAELYMFFFDFPWPWPWPLMNLFAAAAADDDDDDGDDDQ